MVISWDIALSEAETGDSSAGVVLLNRGDKFYVLEVAKGQFPFGRLIANIIDMVKRYSGSTLLIEESPISLGLIQTLRENNLNVVWLNEIFCWQNDPSLLIANRTISSSGDAKRRKRTDDCGTVVMVRDGFEDIDVTSIGKQITDQRC
jgi:hypothetical protein